MTSPSVTYDRVFMYGIFQLGDRVIPVEVKSTANTQIDIAHHTKQTM